MSVAARPEEFPGVGFNRARQSDNSRTLLLKYSANGAIVQLMTATAFPPGYKGMRGDILIALKKAQTLTAKELAARFGVTANGLRRHLKELELEGVVRYRREVRGVGGPVFAYSLTEAGESLFPRTYDTALAEILESVREQRGDEGVVELFRRQWDQIAETARPELMRLPMPERSARLAEMLTSLGYMAESTGGTLPVITEHNCAIRLIAERFPEVCAAEERFIADLLGAPVTRQAHIAKGANCCEYCLTAESGNRKPETGVRNQESGIDLQPEARLNSQLATPNSK